MKKTTKIWKWIERQEQLDHECTDSTSVFIATVANTVIVTGIMVSTPLPLAVGLLLGCTVLPLVVLEIVLSIFNLKLY